MARSFRLILLTASALLSLSVAADEDPGKSKAPEVDNLSTDKEPLASKDPSASKELSADKEPSANKESAVNEKQNEVAMRLTVIDPYAEVRTGPGRGYPVFYAIEQGETIDVITRRPGWYEIRAARGYTGWTSTTELSRTMQASGAPADLPTVSYGDYLKQTWRAGIKSGGFTSGEFDGADTFSATAGYKFYSWLGVELELGKVYGNDIRGTYYGANAFVEPFSQWRLSPFLSFGAGSMDIDSQPKLVPLNIDSSSYETYSVGSNYYLGRNFVVQGSYRWYMVDTDFDTERLESWNIGFSAFF